jgi:DNA primase large subunit
MQQDDTREKRSFIDTLPMSWETVDEQEKASMLSELKAATSCLKNDEESWFKVEWENVPELVERRQVLLRNGLAYVHVREQSSMVANEFSRQLEAGLEQAARFLPRMDEDTRLAPILHHLSQSFVAPDAAYAESSSITDLASFTAASVESESQHFPLCMQNLQRELRKNSHLKHFARLQYTLFLKGIGLSMNECITFWRKSFKLITDGEWKYMFDGAIDDETDNLHRQVQVGISLQYPSRVRRCWRRCEQTRPRLHSVQLSEAVIGSPASSGAKSRLSLSNLQP